MASPTGGTEPARRPLRPQVPAGLAGVPRARTSRTRAVHVQSIRTANAEAVRPQDGTRTSGGRPQEDATAGDAGREPGAAPRADADGGTVARRDDTPPARAWERREAERMLRLYTRLWEPRNAGPGKPRAWPTDPALAQAITDWRADLGLSKVPLPAPVVTGNGAECRARVLAGLWSGEGDPAPAPTLTETPTLAAAVDAIADEYAAADMASAPGDTSWRAAFERRRAEAESEAARLRWAESAPETWAAWCFGRMREIPDALLRAAGAEADSKARQQVFLGGRDSPVEAFLRFLVAFGGERPEATRRPREARPRVDVFAAEHLPAVIRTCLGQGRAFVLPPDRTPEMALAREAHGNAMRLLEALIGKVRGAKRHLAPEEVAAMLAGARWDLGKRWWGAVQAAGLERIEDPSHVYLRLTPDTDFREAAADLERAGARRFLKPKPGSGRRKETLADVEPLLAAWPMWADTHIGDEPQPADAGSTKDRIAIVTSAVTGAG